MSKIIGTTRSNKPIYSSAAMYRGNPGKYGDLNRVLNAGLKAHVKAAFPDYTAEDHYDAAQVHIAQAATIPDAPLRNDPTGSNTRKLRANKAARGHLAVAHVKEQTDGIYAEDPVGNQLPHGEQMNTNPRKFKALYTKLHRGVMVELIDLTTGAWSGHRVDVKAGFSRYEVGYTAACREAALKGGDVDTYSKATNTKASK